LAKRLTPEEKALIDAKATAWPKFGFQKDFIPFDGATRTQPIFNGDTKSGWHVYDTPSEAAEAFRKKFAKELAEFKAKGN
jgi:hypothetical protein